MARAAVNSSTWRPEPLARGRTLSEFPSTGSSYFHLFGGPFGLSRKRDLFLTQIRPREVPLV